MANIHAPKTIALFGGAFNPPHLAHLFTVTYLVTRGDIDEVWLLPSYKHVFNKEMLSFKERIRLLRSICTSIKNVKICQIESELMFSGRTYDTLEELSKRYPHNRFRLVIGSDNLLISNQWYRFDDLCDRWPLIVMNRPGHEISMMSDYGSLEFDIGPTLPSISSREIRERLLQPVTLKDWQAPPLTWVPHLLREEVFRLYQQGPVIELLNDKLGLEPHSHSLEMNSVFVWGQGKCGGSLAVAMKQVGFSVDSASLRELLSLEDNVPLVTSASTYNMWIIASRDDDIEETAHRLCSWLGELDLDFPQVVAHCSGLSSPLCLQSFQQQGSKIAQFHPLYSFKTPYTSYHDLRGISYYLSGDKEACERLSLIVNELEGRVINTFSKTETLEGDTFVEGLERQLYHTAAVMGANLSMVPLVLSEMVLDDAGITRGEARHALPRLYRSALEAYLTEPLSTSSPVPSTLLGVGQQLTDQDLSIRRSVSPLSRFNDQLTGPLVRGDLNTIKAHLVALRTVAQADSTKNVVVYAYLSLSLVAARLIDRPGLVSFLEKEISQFKWLT